MPGRDSDVPRHRAIGARAVVAAIAAVLVAGLLTAAMVVVRNGGATDRGRALPASPAPLGVAAADPSAPPDLPPPDRIRIGAIGVDSALETLGVDAAGALGVPVDFGRAGWYGGGPAPGDLGPAVIAGHVDSRDGPAVFFRLRDLKPGDVVEVGRGGTWVGFRVVAVERYPKQEFPTEKVYRPTPLPELRLITCGGSFDRGRRSYEDNIVAYALPVG